MKNLIPAADLTGKFAIVTGANSGTGFGVTEHLLRLNATVILACRSDVKCNLSANKLRRKYPNKIEQVITRSLDLADLNSVKSFSDQYQKEFNRLDILVNNAGLLSAPGAVTKQGLEESFGAMHIGHFALTKWLLQLIMKPVPIDKEGKTSLVDAARIVNVASFAYVVGNFDISLMNDTGAGDLMGEKTQCQTFGPNGMFDCCPMGTCPHTNAYARAKLANILHAQELQKRIDDWISTASNGGPSKKFRRVITSSLHPGSVSTNIISFIQSGVYSLVLRNIVDAGYVILDAILSDNYVPGSFFDAVRRPHDLSDYATNGMALHLKNFPEAKSLPFAKPAQFSFFSFDKFLWSRKEFVVPTPIVKKFAPDQVTVVMEKQVYSSDAVASRLWEVSEQIVADWSKQKAVLTTPVISSYTGLAIPKRKKLLGIF